MFGKWLVRCDVALFADNFLELLGDHEIRGEDRQLLVNVPGAETQNEIARFEHVADVAMDPLEPRLIGNAAMSVRYDFISNHLATHSGNGRFVRSVNVGDHDAVRLIEGASEFLA